MDEAPSGGDLADGLDELGVGGLLQEVPGRPGGERLRTYVGSSCIESISTFVCRRRGEQVGQRVDAVAAGHDDVQQHDVRIERAGALDRLLGVRGLADDLEVVLGLEQQPEARSGAERGRRTPERGSKKSCP